MANKKKNTRQSSKLKKSSRRKSASKKVVRKTVATEKKNALKKSVPKKAVPKKKSMVAKPALKKAAAIGKSTASSRAAKKVASRKPASKKVRGPEKAQRLDAAEIERNLLRARASIQSGDLQGLSRRIGSTSESVDELVEEGNAFEAGIVQGIEAADDSDEDEVLSHEVLVDDVPGEYLDED